MGRFTAYDQYGRMVSDFDKSGYDLMRMRQAGNGDNGMNTLDFISLIDGMEYCHDETDKYEEDLIDGYEYIVGCEECPLVDNEGGCLLGERLRQYHEWKDRYIRSEGEWKRIAEDNLRRRIEALELTHENSL